MLKTHKQRASTRKRKRWTQQCTRRGTVAVTYYTESTVGSVLNAEALTQPPEYVHAQVDLHVASTPNETAKTATYAVMVKLLSKPRAERLSGLLHGPADKLTTTRKAKAAAFGHEDRAKETATLVSERDDVERAWVVTF